MLSIKEKVELLDMLKEGRTCAYVGRHYRINESTVRSIKKEEKNIRSTAAVTFHATAKRVVTSRNRTIVKMESALSVWINDCRKKNIALDSVIIRTKAKQLYDRLAAKRYVQNGDEEEEAGAGPSSASTTGPTPFSASKGWFDKFQKRFGLKSVCLHGEAAAASAGAEEYVSTFTDVMEEVGYSPEQVFNMDGTSLFWRRIPSHTFMKEEAKERLTLIMCGNAAGFMIKPGLIYKSKNPPALKNISKSSLPVHWMYNSKAWLTKVLTTSWFHNCFIPEVKLYLAEKGMEFKVVLLLTDNAGGHAKDLEYEGVQVEFLPPNTTLHIQPMDQGIIRAFKALYTRNTLQNVAEAMDTDENFSLQAYWQNYTIASCLQNIQKSINEIKSETLNACWKKLWPEVVHDHKGLTADEIHRSEIDKAVKLAKTLGGEGFMDMTAEDVNDLIDVHAQLLTDEDLEELIQSSSEEEEEQGELVEEEEEKDEQLVEEEGQDKRLVEEEEEEEVGLTLDHLATAARMARELQQVIEEWDPNMVRSLRFSNAIDSAMSPYNIILAQKQNKQRQEERPVTKFITRRQR
ncbi:tigger transposable element-derived protein 1-like [Nematolebias whitei]|uniref:tigger transposable element-derived protein 1-like n=1 Tax=Nematolebias whitei TaxID=451745 RepID=UPI00189A6074|nr:tigger transposable element-derived protein 1-like [Nematolebias whitei]